MKLFKERKFAFPALVLPVQIFSEYILSENIRTGSLICRFLCEIYGDQAVLWNISIPLVFCIKYYAKFSVSNAQKHFLLIQFTDFFLCKGFFCPRANLTGNFLPYISCSANKSEQKNHNVVENRQGTTDKRIYYSYFKIKVFNSC